MLRPARRRQAADRAGLGGADVPVSNQAARAAGRSSISACIADVTGHPYRVQCEQSKLTRILYEQLRGEPMFELQFDAHVQQVAQPGSGVEVAIAARRPDRDAVRPLADRRRRRPQRCAAVARHRLRRLHLAGAISGGEHAVRFPRRHSRPGGGELRRRSGALAFPAADSRPLPRDVSGRGRRKRRTGVEPRICAVADGRGGAGHLATTRSPTSRSTRCTSGSRRRSGTAARSWSATPRTSTIRSAAWA